MAIMMVVILIAFATVASVVYFGSKEDLDHGEHLSAESSRATKAWMQRAQVAEAKRQSLQEQLTDGATAPEAT